MDNITTGRSVNRQSGAVLAVSLVFLTILTILGVTTMNTSSLQNIMASNFQFQIGAMQNAEVSAQTGEAIATGIVAATGGIGFDVFDTTGNEYHQAGTVDPTEQDWTAAGYTPNVNGDGEYLIEYVGVVPMGTGNAVAIGGGTTTAGNDGHIFLINARSVSNKGAKRTVQTTLVTLVP